MYESLSKISRVELLEDVLVVEVLEDGNGVAQLVIDLVFADALLGLFQKGIAVAGQLKT
jgi:hypothetical protein